MTRAEYLEFVQERSLIVANQRNAEAQGMYDQDPKFVLFDTPEVLTRLAAAHAEYCEKVAAILGIDLEYHEEGGPPSQTQLCAISQMREDLRPDPVDLPPLL